MPYASESAIKNNKCYTAVFMSSCVQEDNIAFMAVVIEPDPTIRPPGAERHGQSSTGRRLTTESMWVTGGAALLTMASLRTTSRKQPIDAWCEARSVINRDGDRRIPCLVCQLRRQR